MTVLMPYIMWKKRALIILKIHYYFQKYEDDGKEILLKKKFILQLAWMY